MPLSLADRLVGCLLGLALGDALGFVMEGEPSARAADFARRWVRPGRPPAQGRGAFPFGQYSDDTQLARELLLVFRDQGRFQPDRFAGRIARLFAAGADVGAGPGTRSAARRLIEGVIWTEAATPAPYAGNGAAMRSGPVGLLAQDEADLVDLALAQSRVTHADPRCAAGAVAIAGAVRLAASDEPIDPTGFPRRLAALVAPVAAGMGEVVNAVAEYVGLEPAAALSALHRRHLDPDALPHWRGITGHVAPSVAWSLYAFLRAPDSYLGAIGIAIGAGGDTDTTGAMAGAIAGARLGPGALPGDLVGRLTDRGEWGSDALAQLARECAARRPGAPGLHS